MMFIHPICVICVLFHLPLDDSSPPAYTAGMELRFEWDPRKARRNFAKHGVSFEEAATIFFDPFFKTDPDLEHSEGEERLLSIGRSQTGKLLAVVHTEAREPEYVLVRIISSRRATRTERHAYEEN
jgi:uncharacterized DUF497 family protein